ncbi:hypothetical protein Bpfe_002352 [Biomphalaria pfeifferi]|uniref:Uncharacterized protein n=1 Tax=Biomphalaria pfeifferi TaxID=112525 RepID=A0AAD8FKK8_BIOPF|nr:hypothetical protein Bpfe_002352 [Biomphalaria pfeifferi]
MGHMATISPLPRSWVVKTPLPFRTVYGDTRSSPEIMGSQDSVTGPLGRTFSFPEIMGCQYYVTGAYCLLQHSLPLRSWAVKGPYCLCPHTIFLCDHGQLRLVTGPFGHSFSFLPPDHGLLILLHWCVLFIATHTLPLRSWAVKGPYCLWPHTLFHCDQGQSRIRHRAIWPLIFLPSPRSWAVMTLHMGHMATISHLPRSWVVKTPLPVRIVYGDTRSSPEIMGCQYFVNGAYCL